MTNDGDSVTLTGSKTKELKTKSGKTIAKVSETTYDVSCHKACLPTYIIDNALVEIPNGRHWFAQKRSHGQFG